MTPEQESQFAGFYREHLNKLVVLAYSLTHEWQLAKDVVQDSFQKTLEPVKLQAFLSSEDPVRWMRSMVRNTARNAVRARNRQLKWLISYEECTPLSTNDVYPSEHDTLVRCQELLTSEELRLLKRVTLDGLSHIDAAGELGISMWACYKRVEKIKRKLREALKDTNS